MKTNPQLLAIAAALLAGCATKNPDGSRAAQDVPAGVINQMVANDTQQNPFGQGSLTFFVKARPAGEGKMDYALALESFAPPGSDLAILPTDFLETSIDGEKIRLPALPEESVLSVATGSQQEEYRLTEAELRKLAAAADVRFIIPGARIVQQRLTKKNLEHFQLYVRKHLPGGEGQAP